ncbi:MAG: hypothetical protein R3A79_03370 [Nannocystaceae bacterium]
MIDEDEPLGLAGAVLEDEGDPLLLHQAAGEVEVALAVLDAVLAPRVAVGGEAVEGDRAAELRERALEDLAEDLGGAALLPRAAVDALVQERERGADLEVDVRAPAEPADLLGGEDHPRDALGVGLTVDLEDAVVAQEIVEIEVRAVEERLDRQGVDRGDPLAELEAAHMPGGVAPAGDPEGVARRREDASGEERARGGGHGGFGLSAWRGGPRRRGRRRRGGRRARRDPRPRARRHRGP